MTQMEVETLYKLLTEALEEAELCDNVFSHSIEDKLREALEVLEPRYGTEA